MDPGATRLPADDTALLARALPDGPPPAAHGLFGAGSWLRRVSGEGAVLFGGGCALLLEVAHPLVAAGVAEHSAWQSDPFGRLGRTLAAMNAMAFGDLAQALAAARAVERAHARVQGTLSVATGRFAAGTPYHGRDPALVLWVWGTLVESAGRVYERFVGPLAPEARAAYHREHAVLARLLGAPPECVPDTPEAFRDWFDAVVAADLAVGDAARAIAGAVLSSAAGLRALGGGRLRPVTAALLPAPVRDAYGLSFDEERLEAWAAEIRRLRRARAPRDLDGSEGPR